MTVTLGPTQYGKAETHLVRIVRDTPRHEIADLTVTTALRGDFAAAHLEGDQRDVLPTDSQKNTAYAFAKQVGVSSPERYAAALAEHFVTTVDAVTSARVEVDQVRWNRAVVDGVEHDHTWIRGGEDVRTTAVTVAAATDGSLRRHVVAGLKDLVLLKSTGSEFRGFLTDRYTTLPETDDRIMATSLAARWRYAGDPVGEGLDLDAVHASVRQHLVREFAVVHSKALQQTLWHMGRAALEAHPEITEMRLSAPNKHHFEVDLTPFGVESRGEVFHADDRPYGLIQATVVREGADPADVAWEVSAGFA